MNVTALAAPIARAVSTFAAFVTDHEAERIAHRAVARALDHYADRHAAGDARTTSYAVARFLVIEYRAAAPAAEWRAMSNALGLVLDAVGLSDDEHEALNALDIDALAEDVYLHEVASGASPATPRASGVFMIGTVRT